MIRTVMAVMVWSVSVASGQAVPNRPQHPTEPVPYQSETVTVPVAADEAGDAAHTLAGTITLPDAARWGVGPYPGVVLVSGSGPQNRDADLMGHKWFLVLADHLTRQGFAVLRYDDRGVGESTGDFASGTIRRFARDAMAAADALRAHDAVDDERVGVIGHSEGGAVAPIVAVEQPSAAFVVILAGMGVPGSEILLYQSSSMFQRGGQSEDWIEANTAVRRDVFDAVGRGAGADEVRPLVAAWVEQEFSHIQKEEDRARLAGQLMAQFSGDWMREFCSLDPRDWLRRVSVPTLALNGTLDTQVTPEQNLTEIEAALLAGPCPSATTVRMKNLNHLFQPAVTGTLGEYATIETTFDPHALGVISGWMRATVGE